MYTYFFEDGAAWYTVPALVGTLFFLLRLKLMLLGAADLGVDPDISDSSEAFQILSIQTIGAFAMGFGCGGLGALRGLQLEGFMAVAFATLCGAGMVWLLAMMLRAVSEMQSSGNIELAQMLGKEGVVYSLIPEGGQGQVQIIVSERQRMVNAVAAPGEDGAVKEIVSGTRVRVVSTNPDNTVSVVRV